MTDRDLIRYCPNTGHGMVRLKFVEICYEDEYERKTSWTCPECDVVVYIVDFKKD